MHRSTPYVILSVSEVEESSHLWKMGSQTGVKILRLLPKICDFLQSLRMTDLGCGRPFITRPAFLETQKYPRFENRGYFYQT